jgi:hypothetical protein
MRMSCTLMVAGMLLIPLQAAAQSGGAAGATTGTGGTSATPPGATTSPTGSPNAAMPGPPGTNALGTAQSSGRGATTGSASGSSSVDEQIRAEDPKIDRKLKSICRGC